MRYRLLADALVVLHAGFVLFVVLGGLLALFWTPRAALAHIPAAIWGIYIEVTDRVCPLTPLEQRLRALAGQQGWGDGFIDHYVVSLLYPGTLTRGVQLALAALVLLVNTAVYGLVLLRMRRPAPPGER